MKNIILATFIFCILLGCTGQSAQVEQLQPEIKSTTKKIPSGLLVEGNITPLNVHNLNPRLSWHANVKQQTGYQIQVASTQTQLINNQANLWDSGQVLDKKSRNIAYQGRKLGSNESVFWRVRVWSDGNKNSSHWSDVAKWEMGLLNKSDWQAKWLQVPTRAVTEQSDAVNQWINLVGTVEKEDGRIATTAIPQLKAMPTASLFRHQFAIDKQLVSAKLHSTAGGYYELFINGKVVKDRIMDPGQTDFDKRILYNTDEVRDLLIQGNNVIGVHLGSGWYDEDIAFSGWKNPDATTTKKERKSYTFGQPTFIAQLHLTFSDGSTQVVSSNENWLSHPSPVVKEGIFSGELYDASKNIAYWNKAQESFDSTTWQSAKELITWPTNQLVPQLLPPIRPIKDMVPVTILQPKENVWVFDFGQNFTGIPTLHLDQLNLTEGQAVYLRFAEWQDKQGNISQLSGGG